MDDNLAPANARPLHVIPMLQEEEKKEPDAEKVPGAFKDMSRAELQIFASSLGDAYLEMFASFRVKMQDDAAAAGHVDFNIADADPMAAATSGAANLERPMMKELGV